MKTLRLFALLAIVAVPLLADPPGKSKDWANSPQGWFMTKAERAQWSAIKSDAEADAFVTKFLASRGPDFPALVSERVAAADKYLTYGKTPGSQTLRGKIIVLLGPPTSFGISERESKRAGEGTTSASVASAGSTGGGGMPNAGDVAQAVQRGDMGANKFRNYDIGYTAEKSPTHRPLAFTVELDTTRNSERITNKKSEEELTEALELAAAASVRSSPASK